MAAGGAGARPEDGGRSPSTASRAATGRARRKVLGLGFWVQGFRCFPWTAVNFYLKDGIKVAPATLQLLQNSANVPFVWKPLFGFLSDVVYIRGQHRLPYIAIGALLQALSWFTLAIIPDSLISIPIFTVFLVLSNVGAAFAEVANDAIVAETGTQSLVSTIFSFAGAVGNLLSGAALAHLSPRAMFFLFGFLLTVQFFETIDIPESSLNLQNQKKAASPRELLAVLGQPEIFFSIAWIGASYAAVPILTLTLFYYQTEHLGLSAGVLSLTKFLAQAFLLLWAMVYNRKLRNIPTRKLLCMLQAAAAVFILSDVLFVRGVYREMGIPDWLYAVIVCGFQEALLQFKLLPFSVMVAKLCPPGCEGSVMAFLTSTLALAGICSGYLGIVLAGYFGVSSENFSGLPEAIAVEAACFLLPLFISSWIPDDRRRDAKTD